MFGLQLNQAKALFFDRHAVQGMMDKKSIRVLSQFGAYVRRTAKGLIRRAKSASKPGSPPHSHTDLLRDYIFFSYDPAALSVVIGPVKLATRSENAPEVLEHGGLTTMGFGPNRGKRVRIAARPFMQPAMDKEEEKLPALWAGGVK